MGMEIWPLSDALGVEVRGLDLRAPLAADELGALRDAWRRAHLLLVRDPGLPERDQIRFVANFGPVLDESMQGEGGASYVSNRRPDGFAREGELYFHSDLAFTPAPLHVLSLYALEVPAGGSPTLFANAGLAARTLPARLRERASGLRARHLFDLVSQRQDLRYRLEQFPDAAQAVHPLLVEHHATREPILFVSQMQTDRILGLPDAEAEALLEDLLAHLYRPEHVYRHDWQTGDLLVWDNWALQHARPPFDSAEPRTLRRVVAGELVVKAYEHLA
jgi:taurine dioxygenase